MQYFAETVPAVHEVFRSYVPVRYQLARTDGFWNLKDTTTDTLVYQENPEVQANRTVNQFIAKPFCYRLSLLPTYVMGTDDEAHTVNINKMAQALEDLKTEYGDPRKPPITDSCRCLLVNGIGLGYHLTAFVNSTEIHHLSIVEPDSDIVFAAMHLVDWEAVCKRFDGTGRSINLIFSATTENGIGQLVRHMNRVGLYNFARTHIYTHIDTPNIRKTVKLFVEQLRMRMGGLGYFDDERIGLAHTLANIRGGAVLLDFKRKFPAVIGQKPVFIVANGPSLDLAVDMLKANQDKAIIISCGSALGSLYELGIKPDVHVEMERPRPQVEWIEETTNPEYRKGILLLTINTTHPDMLTLFEHSAMGLKPADSGSYYLLERLDKLAFNIHLERCNPTVGNAGIAFASALGFEEIYLVGLDLGTVDPEQHHSKFSAHYRMDDETFEALGFNGPIEKGHVVVPGNFGGEVTASLIFTTARHNVEHLLKEHQQIRCYNTSSGAFINGAEPTAPTSVSLKEVITDKASYVQDLIESYALPSLKLSIQDEKLLLKQYRELIPLIDKLSKIAGNAVKDIADFWNLLDILHRETYQFRNSSKYGSRFFLIKGSIDVFLLEMANFCYLNTDDESTLKHINNVIGFFRSFLKSTRNIVQNGLFDVDSKFYHIGDSFKNSNYSPVVDQHQN